MNAPEPMRLHEAVEVIKIMKPYVDDMVKQDTGAGLVSSLIEGFISDNTEENITRLIALMRASTYAKIEEKYLSNDEAAKLMLVELIECFGVNPIPDLVNAGAALGLLERGWTTEAEE